MFSEKKVDLKVVCFKMPILECYFSYAYADDNNLFKVWNYATNLFYFFGFTIFTASFWLVNFF